MAVVESFLINPRSGCRPYGRSLQGTWDFSVGLHNIFRDNRDYAFRDQIQRASISIMNNPVK